MKKYTPLFVVFALVILGAAVGLSSQKHTTTVQKTVVSDTIRDTVYIPTFDYAMKDSMIDEMNRLRDTLYWDKMKFTNIKFRLKICQHDPKQTKFLVGWISRIIR